jgi:hypothetical protein
MLSADPLPNQTSALDCADNAKRFRINPLSCASPHGHPRLLCRDGLWWALAANPADTLRWDYSIDRLAPQDRKGEQPAGIDLTKRGIARDLAAPAMAIGSDPLSSTT